MTVYLNVELAKKKTRLLSFKIFIEAKYKTLKYQYQYKYQRRKYKYSLIKYQYKYLNKFT
jgi:hypothetical protein